jgi:TolB-like protein
MKRIMRIAVAILILGTAQLFAQSETIAILPFDFAGAVDSTTASAVTEFVQNAFSKQATYKVLERKQIQKVLKEQSFQSTGVTETAVEAGKLLAVNKVVVGSINKLGEKYTLVMNLVDVKTGEVLKSEKKSAQIPIEDIDNVLIDPMVELLVSVKQRTGFTLVIKKGTGIEKMDLLSDTDAWISVSVGNRFIGRTKLIQDNNNPEFNERFEISNYANEIIILTVFDHDVTGDELIGQVTIKEPKNGLYPILGNINGQIRNRGQIEVFIE